MSQSKWMSFVEAVTNTLIGLVIAFLLNAFLMAAAGVQASAMQNAFIVIGHTVVSVVRSYLIRRVFNGAFRHICFKGATAYEWQIGKLYGRICHLEGDHWRWKPWRRFSIGWQSE